MMRFPLVLLALHVPMPALAETSVQPETYVSPFSTYQRWGEPVVRDWQDTHRLITEEPGGHAGHHGMTMPNQPEDNAGSAQQPSPQKNMKTMPEMDHKGMHMPGMSHDTMPPHKPSSEGSNP